MQEKLIRRLTFNPGSPLTGFRTTARDGLNRTPSLLKHGRLKKVGRVLIEVSKCESPFELNLESF